MANFWFITIASIFAFFLLLSSLLPCHHWKLFFQVDYFHSALFKEASLPGQFLSADAMTILGSFPANATSFSSSLKMARYSIVNKQAAPAFGAPGSHDTSLPLATRWPSPAWYDNIIPISAANYSSRQFYIFHFSFDYFFSLCKSVIWRISFSS